MRVKCICLPPGTAQGQLTFRQRPTENTTVDFAGKEKKNAHLSNKKGTSQEEKPDSVVLSVLF